jgi:hypothetical protein
MKAENLIHIKLDYGEALQSKKDILYTEMDLLRILKLIKKYKTSRLKELELKIEIQKKLRQIKKEISHIELIFPKIKIPKILKHEEYIQDIKIQKKSVKNQLKKPEKLRKYGDEIEAQLKDLQKQLQSLN